MANEPTHPIRPTDAQARALARAIMQGARTAALAVIDPETGGPHVSRIAFGRAPDGTCLTLVSDIARHARALRADQRASLLLGEPGAKGDPLAQPRLTLAVTAGFVAPDDPERPGLRAAWLAQHPKARLYADFADFHFVRLEVSSAFLNGGFGKAYAMKPVDLVPG
ncbi:HugZ family pyridoxamine 5'-phosphate oxidase [Albidovulum sp.]|uniref:HugZ family pyridoxamine 5'-phosphate oxidase n=1 Tax=Albidovulum sp. TaxID=1872424 RepID=UPI003528A658